VVLMSAIKFVSSDMLHTFLSNIFSTGKTIETEMHSLADNMLVKSLRQFKQHELIQEHANPAVWELDGRFFITA